jgi:hypothetical protein
MAIANERIVWSSYDALALVEIKPELASLYPLYPFFRLVSLTQELAADNLGAPKSPSPLHTMSHPCIDQSVN